jgi:hypothetical protein
MFVFKTVCPSQKKVEPRCLQLEVGGRKSLESLHVADCDEIILADFRDNGDVCREIEVNGQLDKFVKRPQIFVFDKRDDNEHSVFFQPMNEQDFQLVEVRQLMDKIVVVYFCWPLP